MPAESRMVENPVEWMIKAAMTIIVAVSDAPADMATPASGPRLRDSWTVNTKTGPGDIALVQVDSVAKRKMRHHWECEHTNNTSEKKL